MPAVLAHDFFAQDAFGSALESVDLYTPDERDAFLLGSQGPDPLFYLLLLPPLEDFRKLGSRMHHEGPSSLLVAMHRAVEALDEDDRSVGRAYLAGFVCHYLLDCTVHPLVEFWSQGICQAGLLDLDARDMDAVHADVERDLDEMALFVKRNQAGLTYRAYEETLRASDEVLNVIGKVYFSTAVAKVAEGEPTAVRVYPIAVRCYRVALRAMYSPHGVKKKLVGGLERLVLHERYAVSQAMAYHFRADGTSVYENADHRPWRNPFTDEIRHESFWDLYNGALAQAGSAIATVLDPGFDREAAKALTGGLNFSGEPVE
ncbi:MAG: hypothetical protein IKF14_04245 [Atopobiaceae bacterium]|nr:hypothetical protein [Atopobiaceae bacterium]